jgi:hypothetical protein
MANAKCVYGAHALKIVLVLVVVLVLEKPFHPARLKYLRLELWVISAPQS